MQREFKQLEKYTVNTYLTKHMHDMSLFKFYRKIFDYKVNCIIAL